MNILETFPDPKSRSNMSVQGTQKAKKIVCHDLFIYSVQEKIEEKR
jgi:hypothetical protein